MAPPPTKTLPLKSLILGLLKLPQGESLLILKADGSLHTFGSSNFTGQLGDGTTSDRHTPTQILSSGIAQIATGAWHSLIVMTNGSLRSFGKNHWGQLGDGTTTDRHTPTQILVSGVAQVTGGHHHSLILKTDGS